MPDDPVLAYLAGIVDADGFITIHRKAGRTRAYFSPVIGITGTRLEPHDLASASFGGRVREYANGPANRRMFHWGRSGQPAAQVISAIGPFLRIKARQGEIALLLAETMLVAEELWPMTLESSMDDLYEEMASLNLRGGRTSKSGGRELDGRTWDEYPTVAA